MSVNTEMAALGKTLYDDANLSGDGSVACASCHVIADGGDDARPTSVGINGQLGPINAPTVLNAVYNIAQFWDGRAASLEEQARGPVANPIEMGGDWANVVEYLQGDADYQAAFDAVFEGEVSEDNAVAAIAEFERTLVTPDSPFDLFLVGDDDAMSDAAVRGFVLFDELGCVACHGGPALGGSSFNKLGVEDDYFEYRGEVTERDFGRYNVTKDENDRYVFKTPILRNVELTAPYFHDGQVETLDEAVRIMLEFQLGRTEYEDSEVDDLVAFLTAQTGSIPQ